MNESQRPPILQIMDQIEASEGLRRRTRAKAWGYTFYAFSSNALELQQRLREYENPGRALAEAAITKSLANEQYRADLIRYLHNFLASAKSLIDHTRNFMYETYAGAPILIEYIDRVQTTFATSGNTQFVHDLRNYILHKEVPIIGERFTIKQGEPPVFTVGLNLYKMRRWDRWSAAAKNFMSMLPEHVRLAELIDPYVESVVRFHEWLSTRRKEADRPVMEELRGLIAQYQELDKSRGSGSGLTVR